MNTAYTKWVKMAAGLVALVVLLTVVSRYWGEYRTSTAKSAAVETSTATAGGNDTSKATAVKGVTLVVLTDGLNLRKSPDRTSNAIRGLKKGERVTVLQKTNGWYRVQDRKKVKGWISSSASYTKVAK